MKKPVIAINADFTNPNGDKPGFTYVASGYYDAISKVGGIPFVLPPLEDDQDLEQLLDNVDGVVLVGAPISTLVAMAGCFTRPSALLLRVASCSIAG